MEKIINTFYFLDVIFVKFSLNTKRTGTGFAFWDASQSPFWEVMFSPVCLSVSRISQKVVNGFERNLVDRLGV